jgi:site-specific DNA-cytosine methylase
VELTHASFFSGVGGLDLGLERAGWRTVSFSEIDPYASAVLAERWPGVPNLGDITSLRPEPAGRAPNDGPSDEPAHDGRREAGRGLPRDSAAATLWSGGFPNLGDIVQLAEHYRLDGDGLCVDGSRRPEEPDPCPNWTRATLWSGGFPCQDLSVAGKRAGFAGERSSLAFAFLDLVERHRPPAILLENVPGLLSSNRGRDFGTLLDRLAELGYWWAYRVLDAQYFGVPQRRRRVFILALHAGAGFGADGAAAVLSVGARCDGHFAAGDAAGEGVAERTGYRLGSFGGFSARDYKSSNHLVGAPPDPVGVRAADGLAGRIHDSGVVAFTKRARVSGPDTDDETWVDGTVMPTLNAFDVGDTRTTAAIVSPKRWCIDCDRLHTPERCPFKVNDDPLLPLGLDSHRYRCCGNGVVSNVAKWIGVRLAEALA